MTFVGRLLIFLQLILSVCFMAFAGAVVSVQTSWKQKAESLQFQVSDLNSDLQAKTQEMAAAIAAKEAEIAQVKDQNANLVNTNNLLSNTTELQKTQLETVQKQRDLAQAQYTTQVDETEARRASDRVNLAIIENLRGKLQELVEANRKLNDEIFKEKQTNKRYLEKYNSQLEQVAALTKALIVAGLDPQEAVQSGGGEIPPPDVQGLVLEAQQNSRQGVELVEISIGTNDGLRKGHQLHVYRLADGDGKKTKYLGRIKLVLLTANKAVGTVIDKAKNGIIERGDNVTTRL